jgi:putative flippase GtrA
MELTRELHLRQFGRYLLVGAWNTLFAYGSFALLTAVLTPVVPYGYMWASLLANLLNITVSYLGYKWFVFKTKGNYLREWLRCLAVYGGGMGINLLALPVLVMLIRRHTLFYAQAPYIAGAILAAVTAVYSFAGHKRFSFRPARPQQSEE